MTDPQATETGTPPAAAPATFREAYAVLRGHAQALREQREPNIDDLLRIVEESVQAYQVCKKRIDAVDKALQQTLAGADAAQQAPDAPQSNT